MKEDYRLRKSKNARFLGDWRDNKNSKKTVTKFMVERTNQIDKMYFLLSCYFLATKFFNSHCLRTQIYYTKASVVAALCSTPSLHCTSFCTPKRIHPSQLSKWRQKRQRKGNTKGWFKLFRHVSDRFYNVSSKELTREAGHCVGPFWRLH